METIKLLLFPQGRMGRLKYFLTSIVLSIIALISVTLLMREEISFLPTMSTILSSSDSSDLLDSIKTTPTMTTFASLYILLLFMVTTLTFYINLIVVIKRLHDINMSGWWLILFLLISPAMLLLLFIPGTEGANKYGDQQQ